MTDEYIAGLIDGEGCIGHYSKGAKRGRRVILKIDMTNEQVLTLCQGYFGLGTISSSSSGKDRQWRWIVRCRQAEEVLTRVLPFLIVKRKDALEALRIRKSLRRYTKRPVA